ncbi:ABC transporter ATP-binding protein [Microbacterium oleivorans]|uniref:ABC transporter ATP-binding protein n=1 Tax=Microbacterium oleivorans TaxID=273677 RepID=UPI00080DF2B7|nr:ATP-binding cassette domain-containing protein [Microbacterium oleivorans]
MLELRTVSKSYNTGGTYVRALAETSVLAPNGAVVWLAGASGSGKSTLLGIAGLLTRPDSGTVLLDGEDLTDAPDARRTDARQRLLGFVPQQPRLFGDLTVEQNVSLAHTRTQHDRIASSLALVGISHRARSLAKTLSGGEQQRVAIARAVQHAPAAVLADEPTSSLDDENAQTVLGLFRRLADEGRCVLIASHDARVGSIADAIVNLMAGAR